MKTNLKKLILGTLAFGLSACNHAPPRAVTSQGPSKLEGGNSGGGGVGVLCASGLRTLDLYEAEVANGLTIQTDQLDFNLNLETFAPKLLQHYGAKAPAEGDTEQSSKDAGYLRRNVVDLFKFIPQGEKLTYTNDATVPKLEPGCRVVQIAIYHPDGTISVDQEYWSQLSPLNQVSLVLHEFVYFMARTYSSAVNSDEARKVIGSIFTGTNKNALVPQSVLIKPHLECHPIIVGTNQPAKEFMNFIVTDEDEAGVSGLAIYFKQYNTKLAVSRTRAFFPGFSLAALANGNVVFSSKAINANRPETWNVDLKSQGLSMIQIRMSSAGEPLREFSDIPCVSK